MSDFALQRTLALMKFADSGACVGKPTSWWYPSVGDESPDEGSRRAAEICFSCPVQSECLDYAIRYKENYGIWGGQSSRSRLRIKRRRANGMPDGAFVPVYDRRRRQ